MDVRRLALIQVLGSLLSIVMVIWLARWLHLYGALLALIVSCSCCGSSSACRRGGAARTSSAACCGCAATAK